MERGVCAARSRGVARLDADRSGVSVSVVRDGRRRAVGAGAGVLTPGGNLASFIDRMLFGRHLLNRLYDPEGLLSTVPAVATALGGVFAGNWLKEPRRHHRAAWLWAAGFAAMTAGLAWG